jgi:hypothetical protein
MNINGMENKTFLTTTIVKSILLIAGIWFAATNGIVRGITLVYTIFTLIGTTVLLIKTNNFFREILDDDFTEKMNQIGVWIMMGLNASLLIGLIFNNPVLRVIGIITAAADLIAAIYKLIVVIREERIWRGINLDYEILNAMRATEEESRKNL